jgi:hypothetical protein
MYLVCHHIPHPATRCQLDITLGIDLLRLVETHKSSADGPTAAFRRALADDSAKTQNLVAAFVSMTSPHPTHEYDELVKKCQEATMQVSFLVPHLLATQSRH